MSSYIRLTPDTLNSIPAEMDAWSLQAGLANDSWHGALSNIVRAYTGPNQGMDAAAVRKLADTVARRGCLDQDTILAQLRMIADAMDTRDKLELSDGSQITVWSDGTDYDPSDAGERQRYTYRIATAQWSYTGNDIRSGVGAEVDTADALRTLCSFLGACAESGEHARENASLFPPHVRDWAQQNDDEIAMASMEEESAR